MAEPARPPAILLGADTPIGLTVIRELGEAGVPVHAIARGPRGIGLYSRWTTRGYLRPNDDDEVLALIDRIGETEGARFVLTVSEADALFLRSAADGGRLKQVRALVPPADKLALVNDKMATYAAAEAAGVPYPATWQPADGDVPGDPPAALTYPAIVKWRDPGTVADALTRHGLDLVKAEYCYDIESLGRILARYRPIGHYPMVQAFCAGVGIGQMFFMHRGVCLQRFQHIRRAEWPPEGGVSTVCESLPVTANADLLARSEALLRHIGWEGAAMVEYRFDPATARAALMEINGRFWGSLPLAYHAGARFAWLTYAALGLGERPDVRPYRSGLVCRYMIPETRRLLTVVARPKAIQDRTLRRRPLAGVLDYLFRFIDPRTRYYVFAPGDPGPFLADMGFVLRKALGLDASPKTRRIQPDTLGSALSASVLAGSAPTAPASPASLMPTELAGIGTTVEPNSKLGNQKCAGEVRQ